MLTREFSRYGTVRCGGNWRFGRDGIGDWRLLRARGIGAEIVPYAEFAGAPVSSSRIRSCLAAGDIAAANAMLGRRYSRRLAPSPGKGMGSALGYATVNFPAELPLGTGVYAVTLDGEPAIANYGRAPTAGASAWSGNVLEVHQLRGEPRIRGLMEVAFDFFIRPERKFASFDELRCQIALDCGRIKP
jgi:riboflavin kinase/FMN adenylyltransferase